MKNTRNELFVAICGVLRDTLNECFHDIDPYLYIAVLEEFLVRLQKVFESFEL